MINGKKILAIIPLRGGSKGVPQKNIREVDGKPLFMWSVEQAHKSSYIDRLIISTDDDEIMAVTQKYGCEVPFKRPDALATDEAKTIDVILHALANVSQDYDYVVLLQATSPLRTTQDIDRCISLCEEGEANSVVTVTELEKPLHWIYRKDQKNKITPLLSDGQSPSRRQDSGPLYQLNGAVYVNDVQTLIEDKQFINETTLAHVMPAESSLDIDTELDFLVFEQLVTQNKHNR